MRYVLVVVSGAQTYMYGPYSGSYSDLVGRLPEILWPHAEEDPGEVLVIGLVFSGGLLMQEYFSNGTIDDALTAAAEME